MPIFDYPRVQFHPDQITQLRKWCEYYKPRIIVEVGCWLGKSTSVLGQYAKENRGIVLAVDWWKDNADVGLVNDEIDIFKQFRLNMDELELSRFVFPIPVRSTDASKFISDNSVDMVFIDADHKYSSVVNDIDEWVRKVKSGGVICGHDFESFDYDDRYIEQDVYAHRHHGVIKAVTDKFADIKQAERMWLVEL